MEINTPEASVKTEILVSKESFHDWRLALATLREKKGMEDVVVHLGDALLESASLLGLHTDVVELYQENALSGQHMMMNELARAGGSTETDMYKRGLEIMAEAVYKAHGYIQEHNLNSMLPRSYRYLGRVEDYKGNYREAAEYYTQSIPLFEAVENPLVRVNRLEIQGFLAFSLIKSGKIKEGLDLAARTSSDFKESPDGIELRQADYYTWAVWASGIPIRTVEALIDTRALKDKKWAEGWINQAEGLLVIPEGDETWGDKNFDYRKDEIRRVRGKLSNF